MRIVLPAAIIATVLCGQTPTAHSRAQTPGAITVTTARNPNASATPEFKFTNIPSPMKDDAGSKAVVRLVDGEGDPNGAGLNALIDGLLPREEDEPGSNFFFNAGTGGGRLRLDLGSVIDIAEVRTYSWHPNTRGPQVYTLFASDGSDAKFKPAPPNDVDPTTVGWTLLASVDARTPAGDPGGQYAVSVKRAGGTLGRIRHLLLACTATEFDDDWGNTFFSEIDVIKAEGKSQKPEVSSPRLR